MGNYASCAPTALLRCNQSQTTKVIFPTGELRQFEGAMYAAELMLDAPNHFLVSTQCMHEGRRFSPLSADEELEPGCVYAMFPMKRANSVITAADLVVAVAAARRLKESDKIQPETLQASPADACDSVRIVSETEAPWSSPNRGTCRSRKPSLETINEETIASSQETIPLLSYFWPSILSPFN